jgi:surfeit locus 1 family protein
MLRALLRPSAIVSHVLVLAVAITCVVLGQWQFDRLGEVRAINDRLAERLAMAPVELSEVTDEGAAVDDAAWEFRRVEATGTFRPEEEVLQRNRDHQGQAGFHVLTPLELQDGAVVLVRRGWVPNDRSEPPVADAAPPGGDVEVTGYLERPVSQPGFGAQDPAEGELARVFHPDTARLDRQVTGELFPMVLTVESTAPATPGDLPLPIGEPQLDEGNHLSYALQWYSFALLALVTYGAWWWTRFRRQRTGTPPPGPADDQPSDRPTGGPVGAGRAQP